MEIIDIQEVKRGFRTPTDEFVFNGQITQFSPEVSTIKIICKNRLYDAIKSAQTKSWDKDIDTSAGVGSEIFKEICDNSSLSYTPALTTLTDGSVYNTGSIASSLIAKFIQNDEDDFDKMNELANAYNFIITYDYANDRVNFKPKGFTSYPIALNVGTEIPGQIKWKENMEQMINYVKIKGATVYDKVEETFAGPATTFTLQKTPEDTEVRDTNASGTVFVRGQNGVGTIGTDFDYYVDVERKQLVFSGATSNIWIRYGAQVPLPVIAKNQTSIDKYGGPNKIPHFKKLTFSEIKDLTDAQNKAAEILNKYSVPFISAANVPILDSVIQTNGVINPGVMINIIDKFTNKDVNVFVKEVKKSWPHVYDKITVGDQTWRTESWQADQMKKINLIFNELNKNQDILYQSIDINRETAYERRDIFLDKSTSISQESHDTGDDDYLSAFGVYWKGQSFTTTSAFTCTQAKIKAYRIGTPETATLSIYATDGSGLPTGASLADATFDADTFTTSSPGAWYTFLFTSNVELTDATKYALVLKAPAGTGISDAIRWRNSPSAYAGGNGLSSNNSGRGFELFSTLLVCEIWFSMSFL